jgi:epoxyqueuosine reductase
MLNNANDIKLDIIKYAKSLKIDAIGFCDTNIPQEDLLNYQEFLASGNYEDMLWLESRREIRMNPLLLNPQAKGIIVLGFNYFDNTKEQKDYQISIYANQKRDYHKWVYAKIRELAEYLTNNYGDTNRYFVDSAPVLEKVFAKKTAIGWQGKHTCIVSREFGSWLFLGVILTSLDIIPDVPHGNFCGSCEKCLVACPTGALTPYKLEVKKCLSYLTIEHKHNIPQDLHGALGNRIFGCDECLVACHFNKWQKQSNWSEVYENPNYPKTLIDLLNMNEEDFIKIFSGTPIKRTGYLHILKNIIIVAQNSKNKDLIPHLQKYLNFDDVHVANLAQNAIIVLGQN